MFVLAAKNTKVFGGDTDGLSAFIALVSLGVSASSGVLAYRTLRLGETDTKTRANDLAGLVREREAQQLGQLLGDDARTIDVGFALTVQHEVDGAADTGTLNDVVGYFLDLCPQRLIITGVPGAGKTVLAIELILGLLDVRKPDEPVPVRISATAWDPGTGRKDPRTGKRDLGPELQEMLVDHLIRTSDCAPSRPGHWCATPWCCRSSTGSMRWTAPTGPATTPPPAAHWPSSTATGTAATRLQ
ncbi:hypothetical protein BJF79_20855 [Actinomadura sp. CNU-125]|nr:hypothetical protein BJF79_20855 [Actinomadura sp. CNU-125]